MEETELCEHCEGGGDICNHPERFGDDCPEGLDDCDSCNFLKQCSECSGMGVKQSQKNHAPDKVGGLDKPEKGQALGLKPQHAADGNKSGLS